MDASLLIALTLAALVGVSLGLLGGGGSILTVPILSYVLGMDPREAIASSLFIVGIATGLVGAGGGFLVVPALTLFGGLPMAVAVGTSLLVIAMKSFAGLGGYLLSVQVNWPVVLAFTAIAVAGSFAGAALAGRVPERALRRGFGVSCSRWVASCSPRNSRRWSRPSSPHNPFPRRPPMTSMTPDPRIGRWVPGYQVPVLDERAVRAGAGILKNRPMYCPGDSCALPETTPTS